MLSLLDTGRSVQGLQSEAPVCEKHRENLSDEARAESEALLAKLQNPTKIFCKTLHIQKMPLSK